MRGREWKKKTGGDKKWGSDREALELIKVKLSAFTYLDEHF